MIKYFTVFVLTVNFLFAFGQSFDKVYQEIESSLSNELWKHAEEQIEYSLENYDVDDATKANLYHNLGYCKLELQDYIGAKYYLQNALKLKQTLNQAKNHDYAKTAQLLGDLSLQIGDYDRAREYLIDAQSAISNSLGTESDEYVESLLNLGQFYETVGNYKTAHAYFTDALKISEAIHHHNSSDYAAVLNHIGRIYIRNNELDLAERVLSESNQIFASLGPDYATQYVESLENLAVLYQHKGDFAKSEKLLLRIESEKRKIPDLPEELLLETLNDLGILYMDLENTARAQRYFEEVRRISGKELGAKHKYYATAINNLAAIAKHGGDYDRAKELLLEAISIYEEIYGKVHPQYANALNNLASIERLLGEYDLAEQYYKDVLEVDRVIYGETHPNYATTLNNLGILYSSMGNFQAAGEYYRQATQIRKISLGVNHPSYARSVENLGLHYFALGELALAEQYLKESIDIQIDQISSVFPTLTESERSLFYQNIREDIERYNHIAYLQLDKRPELIRNILNHQIATKGILFSSSERIREAVAKSNDRELIEQYRKWSDAKIRLAGYYQLGETKLARFGIKLSDVEEAIEQMEKSMMLQSEIFAELFKSKEVDWTELRRVLKADQALVEIIRFREFSNQISESSGYFGFTDKVHYMYIIIRPDTYGNPEFVVKDNGAALETKGFSLYKNSVKYESELRTSYLNYWEPVDTRLTGVDDVIVSPDGVYFKMNPNVLKASVDEYVFDKYYVTYITNSRDLLKQKENTATNKTAMLIGNPDFGNDNTGGFVLDNLPGAQEEVEQLKRVLEQNGWDARKYVKEEATELLLKSKENPGILHIATHGYFSDNDPVVARMTPGNNPMFKSGLFLEGVLHSYSKYLRGEVQDSQNDGILSSYEVMNMDLQGTQLVVLSACETALGDIQAGEGVYGLQRAITVAGASNVITSMIKVDDEATQKLMVDFYKRYLRSNDVKTSFRDAQDKLRESYPDPRIWGAFLLTGNG